MRKSGIFISLLVSLNFGLIGGVQIIVTHTSTLPPGNASSPTDYHRYQPPLPTLTVNCSARGTLGLKMVVSLLITSRLPQVGNREDDVGSLGLQPQPTNRGVVVNSRPRSSPTRPERSGTGRRSSDDASANCCSEVLRKTGNLSAEDPLRSFLALEVKVDVCQVKGSVEYKCYLHYYDDTDSKQMETASTSVSDLEPAGPLVMWTQPATQPERKTVTAPVSSPLRLTCGGWVVSEPRTVDIVWQWAAVDSGPDTARPRTDTLAFTEFTPQTWDQGPKTSVVHPQPSSGWGQGQGQGQGQGGGGCVLSVVQSRVVRVVTETDRHRTYRCLPRIRTTARHPSPRLAPRLAASVLVLTGQPRIRLKVQPSHLEFAGTEVRLPNVPLLVCCRELHRPMEPPLDVRIQVLHEDTVMATVCGDMQQQCRGADVSKRKKRESTRGRQTASKGRTQHERTDTRSRKSSVTDHQTQEEDWRPDIRYHTDVTSPHMLYLCVTSYTLTCRQGGRYYCVFDYRMHVPGARPIVLTQEAQVRLPVQVNPQKPRLAAAMPLLQYYRGMGLPVRCTAFIGGPQPSAEWAWRVCRYSNCPTSKSQCFNKSCIMLYDHLQTMVVFNESTCQYKQTSSLEYTFSEKDRDVTEISCYVTRLNTSYWPAARNFSIANYRSHQHVVESKSAASKDHEYQNPLTTLLLPAGVSLSVAVALYLALALTCRRFHRMKRRFRAQTRKSSSRTDHFRKRPRGMPRREEPGDSVWLRRRSLAAVFCRALVTVLGDLTEQDLEHERRQQREQVVPVYRRLSRQPAPRQRVVSECASLPSLLFSMQYPGPVQRRALSLPAIMGTGSPSASRATETLVHAAATDPADNTV